MKNYETFRTQMRRLLAEKSEKEGYRMMESKVYKVNQELDGISIAKSSKQEYHTVLYFQDIYNDYLQRMEDNCAGDEMTLLDAVMKTAWDQLMIYMVPERNLQEMIDTADCIDRVIWELINPQKNEELLKTVPHRQFLDLVIIYRIKFNDTMEAIVTDALAAQMGIDEETLYQAAKSNRKALPTTEIVLPVGPKEQMVFLTTSQPQMYGAALMLESDKIKKIADRMRCALYICPSSIHELVIVSAKAWRKRELEETIWHANRTVTQPEVYLSDTLYYYDREKDEVRIA